MPLPDASLVPPERRLSLGWFGWLERQRRWLYPLIALLYLASFNGLWRVGVDSALYRGLARSLARGQGYVFAGEVHRHAYPGLPWMLAVLDRLFGDASPVPGLVMMTLMALATLWLIDRLIALRYPLWLATVVTVGVALNVRFLRQSQQLMTDIPFTLGTVGALYALERLRLLSRRPRVIEQLRWAIALLAGLGLAAATRPTFGVLAAALVAGSAWRAVRGSDGKRWLHGAILVATVAVLLGLFLVDPRTVGIRPMEGRYEQELVERLHDLPMDWLGRLDALLGRDLNDAFFAQRISYASYGAALLVLFSSALVIRRDVVWGLMIFGLVAVTVPLSSVPRYYIMVMPFMFLGWIVMWSKITLRLPAAWQGPVLALALGFPMMVNGGRSVGFMLEQRAPDVAWLHGKDRTAAFYARYREGIVPKQEAIAKMIADHATPKQLIIGPDAHVLAYFADRRVIGERTLFVDREAAITQWPNLVAKAKPDLAIFPVSLYGDNDGLMRDLIRKRILFASTEVARIPEAQLAVASIRLPPPGVDWRKYRGPAEVASATTRRSATSQRFTQAQKAEILARRQRLADRATKQQKLQKQAKLQRQAKIARRAKAQRQAQLERAAKHERQRKRDRLEQRHRASPAATTQANPANLNGAVAPIHQP